MSKGFYDTLGGVAEWLVLPERLPTDMHEGEARGRICLVEVRDVGQRDED
jgi:hypothetical protein